nr:VWA domain-containing protein [Nocardioides perillae]
MTALDDPRWPLALPVVGLLALSVLLLGARRVRDRGDGLLLGPVAAARVRALPPFRRLRRRRLLLTGVRVVAALTLLVGAALVLSRPTRTQTAAADPPSRDVVVCLDGSGSMDSSAAAVLRAVSAVVDEQRDDRVAIVLFDGAPLTVMPLSDDHAAVRARLRTVADAVVDGDPALDFATQGDGRRLSQVGDGLVSCVQRFDALDQRRGRTVVLATDNDPLGPPLYDLSEAAAYAVARDVVVHAVGPDALTGPRRSALERAARRTGGTLSLLDAGSTSDAADAVVAAIARQEARRLERPPRPRRVDAPGAGALVLGAGALALALACAVRPTAGRPRPADGWPSGPRRRRGVR